MIDFIKTLDWSVDELFSLAAAEIEDMQLPAARDKFKELVDEIPMLNMLADKQGVTEISSLNGRLRNAEASGRLKDFKISPALLARRESLLAMQAERPNQLRNFVKTYAEKHAGRKAIVLSTWASYLELNEIADDLGVRHLFAPGSLATGGGGAKGVQLPEDYESRVKGFLGVDYLPQFYAMTETNCWIRSCAANAYHVPLQTIPFVLDLETGEPKPRSGRQTGRYAFFDLTARTYWGGCVSGDDKITCSGAPKAHDDALNFLAGLDKKQVA